MAYQPTIAVAGASGHFGSYIVKALLNPSLKSSFRSVIILARSASSKLDPFVVAGAELCLYKEDNLPEALKGVDILVSAIGPSGHHFKELLLRAIPESSVSIYFPSEFGLDHYLHDFPHEEWDAKKQHFKLAESILDPQRTRVCRVFAGMFLEDSIGPWFGFNTAEGEYQAVGDPDQTSSFSSLEDVARAVAVLASLPLSKIPDKVYLSGDSKSMKDIADIMMKAGSKPITVTSVPLEAYKAKVLAKPSPTPERYLRFLMGQGLIDHTAKGLGNSNSLVEESQQFGKWRSINDLAKDENGAPWSTSTWEIEK